MPASAPKMGSDHSFSLHEAPDLDYSLKNELSGSAVQVLEEDKFLAFANLQQLWDDPEWSQLFKTLKTDTTQVDLRESWFKIEPFESKQYASFCKWVDRLVTLISELKQPSPRAVSFLAMGAKLLSTTPGYADENEVDGASTSIKPDAVCVLEREADGFESWSQVLVPIEFKKKPGSLLAQKAFGTFAESSWSSSSPSTSERSRTRAKEGDPQAEKGKHSNINIPHRIPSRASPAATPPSPSSPSAYKPTRGDIQLARYAMETLAAVGDRTHVFGLAVNRPEVTLWYFDRCGAIRSQPLNFQDPQGQGFLNFVKFLSALVYMEDDALGFNPFFATSTGTRRVGMRKDLCDISIKISEPGDASLTLKQLLVRRADLMDRATLVYKVQLWHQGEGTGVPVDAVFKSSWQHVQRTSEYDILQKLYTHSEASQHVVEMFYGSEGPTVSSQRGGFGEPKPEVVDDRALRYTVAEYLSPILELSEPFHIPHIGWSVVQAIKFLKGAGWFHRDISVGNIGFQLVSGCQGVIVKLLDFDLSKEIGSSSKAPHWTGTLPFMSIELLQFGEGVYKRGWVHKLGFEVEALMWTLLWIVRVYVDGKEERDGREHPLTDWFFDYRTLTNVANTKKAYLEGLNGFTNNWYRELEPDFKHLARTWKKMREAQDDERFYTENTTLVSDSMYGDEGFQKIETWMEDWHWNVPKRSCTCTTHCARL
ncbi:hypothetical protein M407DRAFT_17339 [Tulasnella calospora MUT 4182]|uniref:Protein kinase domain-containing protein n=1 Tax=Tulasnella calospora MUT 4182 TaxID=1051891 RepID=A0A0C3QXE6_9AGAM|nr:hypothetical protein M407DRAFT_17339 [Tulasnella calospora MUT 4182]